MRFPRLVGALALALAPALVPAQPAMAATAIHGGGSGFAGLEVGQWIADTAGPPLHLSVDYSAQGSSIGRANFAGGLFDYGMSDIVYPPADRDIVNGQTRCPHAPFPSCFVYVPVSAGGLAFMYNLVDNSGNRFTNLQLTPEQACQIFTGEITDWGAVAPGFAGHRINVVVRSDGAGESYVFSQYCIAVAPLVWNRYKDWILTHAADKVQDLGFQQGQPVSSWTPYLIGGSQIKSAQGSDGVANVVADSNAGQDAITYDAAGYAKVRYMPVASVQNQARQYTQPDENNVTIALAYARTNPDPNFKGTFILDFTGGDSRAYFPSTYSYALAQTAGFDPGRGATLGQFLCYAISSQGQRIAPSLRYARLSQQIVDISRAAIVQIPGAPPASGCAPGIQGITNPVITPGGSVAIPGAGGPAGAKTGTTARSGTTGSGTGGAGTNCPTTTTSSPQPSSPTTTTIPSPNCTATTTGPAGTQSTTGAGAIGDGASGQQLGDSNQAALSSQTSGNNKRGSGPSNEQALWAILEGALICALAVALTGWRKRATG